MFLKNAWYVAAWSDEITDELQQVILLSDNNTFVRLFTES